MWEDKGIERMSQDERKKVRKGKEEERRQKESNMARLINRKEVSRMAEGK